MQTPFDGPFKIAAFPTQFPNVADDIRGLLQCPSVHPWSGVPARCTFPCAASLLLSLYSVASYTRITSTYLETVIKRILLAGASSCISLLVAGQTSRVRIIHMPTTCPGDLNDRLDANSL